jgi:acyl-CoA synthetase (NDP forming)
MADAAADLGLDVAPMPEAAQARLKEILPFAATRNPVDVTAQAFNDLSLVERNFEIMIEEGGYDAIVAFLTMVAASPYIVDDLLAMLGALRARHPDRLIVLSLIAAPDIVARYEAAGYLVFEDPCRGVAAAAAVARFGESFGRKAEAPPPALPAPLPPLPEGPVSERAAKAVLAAAGIPVLDERLARSAEAAADAARELGRPVALKLTAPGLAHKTEIGGVLPPKACWSRPWWRAGSRPSSASSAIRCSARRSCSGSAASSSRCWATWRSAWRPSAWTRRGA